MVTGPERVVSLLPALTEIVCALGAEARLVARSHACDAPASVRALPAVTTPRVASPPHAGSRRIDGDTRALLAAALSPFAVDTARLAALRPDLILTQDQCRACAVSLPDLERALAGALAPAPRLLSFTPHTLGDVFECIRGVAAALGAEAAGGALLAALTERVVRVGERSAGARRRPRTVLVEWLDPLMAGGHWTPELIALAGGEPVLARAGERSRFVAWDELRAADPELLVVAPCGFAVEHTRRELALLEALPGWRALAAVRNERVFLADGDALWNRPGPRLVDSLEQLASWIAT